MTDAPKTQLTFCQDCGTCTSESVDPLPYLVRYTLCPQCSSVKPPFIGTFLRSEGLYLMHSTQNRIRKQHRTRAAHIAQATLFILAGALVGAVGVLFFALPLQW